MRHRGRSEAIQSGVQRVAAALDCFVASLLATTRSFPLVPATVRTQRLVDSRLRGNERR